MEDSRYTEEVFHWKVIKQKKDHLEAHYQCWGHKRQENLYRALLLSKL